jgi:hypothetical protein
MNLFGCSGNLRTSFGSFGFLGAGICVFGSQPRVF